MRISVVFDNLGPYHRARLQAAAEIADVLAVEVAASSEEYAWKRDSRDSESKAQGARKGVESGALNQRTKDRNGKSEDDGQRSEDADAWKTVSSNQIRRKSKAWPGAIWLGRMENTLSAFQPASRGGAGLVEAEPRSKQWIGLRAAWRSDCRHVRKHRLGQKLAMLGARRLSGRL